MIEIFWSSMWYARNIALDSASATKPRLLGELDIEPSRGFILPLKIIEAYTHYISIRSMRYLIGITDCDKTETLLNGVAKQSCWLVANQLSKMSCKQHDTRSIIVNHNYVIHDLSITLNCAFITVVSYAKLKHRIGVLLLLSCWTCQYGLRFIYWLKSLHTRNMRSSYRAVSRRANSLHILTMLIKCILTLKSISVQIKYWFILYI